MLKSAGRAHRRTGGMSVEGRASLTAERSRHLRRWRVQALLVGAALACIATPALATLPPRAPSSPAPSWRHGLHADQGIRLPISLTPTASASIGASERSFWAVRHGASLLSQGGGIRGSFTASGAALRVAQGTVGLSLTAVGRGQRVQRVAAVAPKEAGSRILYRHGSLSEFYLNGPYGLEQGFSLRRRPQSGAGPLVLSLRLGGSLIPQQVGSKILFRTHSGATAMRYGELSALDAAGRRLPAQIQVHNGLIQLQINDSRARYPLRIDPFIQQGEKLTGGVEEIGAGLFANSVAVSGDGNTALVGAENDNANIGAVWVFVREGSTWKQQGSKLTANDETGKGSFGWSVSLSYNGNTALIGGESDAEFVGAAWVFERTGPGAAFTQQGSKLTGGEEKQKGEFGSSVKLSRDGNTALIGGFADAKETGAAWVFTRTGPGAAFTQQGPKLTASDETGEGAFGWSVALSSDGNTALIGGYTDNAQAGAAWVFTREGSPATWKQQGLKLTATGEVGGGLLGESVALSADGNTALLGAPYDNAHVGAGFVFTRSGSTWTQQGSKLTASDETGEALFGDAVALSGDGNVALIGGDFDGFHPTTAGAIGAVWWFARTGSTWAQQGSKLTGSGEIGEGHFGVSVALSADGSRALIGGESDNTNVGAAWMFVKAPHYYQNGTLNKAAPRTVTEWGTITLTTVKGGVPGSFVRCHTAAAGTVDNPEGGGPGEGSTQAFATYACESEKICPVGMTSEVVAEKLPWPSVLTEEVEGTIRAETTGIKLFIECKLGEKVESGQKFVVGATEKGQRPITRNGTNAAHPSFLEYDAGSGELEAEGSGGTVTDRTEGSLKTVGYSTQEVLATKNP